MVTETSFLDLDDPGVRPWAITSDHFPFHGRPAVKLRFAAQYAILAPSSHNTQPWILDIHPDHLDLCADRSRRLPAVDPLDRALVTSCGAALLHLRLALRFFSCAGEVTILPDPGAPDVLARVSLGRPWEPSLEERRVFEAITARRTHRGPFEQREVPGWLLDALGRAATDEGALLRVLSSKDDREALADLIADGDRIQFASREFRAELASWMRSNRAGAIDGMPGRTLGLSDFASYVGPFILRTFDHGGGRAARDRELAHGSPVLAVLATSGDGPRDWLAAGQALARILLRARADDVHASFLNQPIEVAELRPRVARLAHIGDYHPQLVLRLGYAHGAVPPTPRRPLTDVVRWHAAGGAKE